MEHFLRQLLVLELAGWQVKEERPTLLTCEKNA
jgi:hypothetical protein